jgi:hypothetical protein
MAVASLIALLLASGQPATEPQNTDTTAKPIKAEKEKSDKDDMVCRRVPIPGDGSIIGLKFRKICRPRDDADDQRTPKSAR